ncbi:MAG: DUF3667 domain-containing protein [Fulvivirga sp.]
MEDIKCRNCGNEVIGNYCHNCGQKRDVHKLGWRSLFEELQKRWFGFDNNFARTVKDLTIAPKKVIGAIIDGIRVRYIGPIGYYFLLVTLFVLTISFLGIDMSEFTKDITTAFSSAETTEQQQLQMEINQKIFSNFRLFSFLLIPFFITATWLIFKNKKYNFLESSVVTFYGQGHPMILSIIALFGYKFFDWVHIQLYVTPISYIYFAFVCANFYKGNKIWNFIKGLLVFVFGLLLFMLVVMIGAFLLAIINPELFKGLK